MVTFMVLKQTPIFEWHVWLGVSLRAALDYGEEVHGLRILEEWSSMIDHEMEFSLARVYTKAMTSLLENLKHERKHDMVTLLFARGKFFGGQVSWATSNPRTRNLASGELQLEVFS
jgi:hypothetical protein